MNAVQEILIEQIMDAKAKAERAECEKDYSHFMEKYLFLKKRWEVVAGNAVIGIEIKEVRS